MLDKWNLWYEGVEDFSLFQDADSTTYKLAADFLADMKMVEDWGCGFGGFKQFCEGEYIGVDGTKTPFVDVVADLRTYTSRVEGIMMRHVLEHNYDWDQILSNAIASFTKKMCLIFFTPFGDKTREIGFIEDVGVPDLSFGYEDIARHLQHLSWKIIKYKHETVLFLEKK